MISAETTRRRDLPPQLYDLTSLQRDANRLLGFTADKTLKLAQSLYETRKALTYPRTDSRYRRRTCPRVVQTMKVLPESYRRLCRVRCRMESCPSASARLTKRRSPTTTRFAHCEANQSGQPARRRAAAVRYGRPGGC